MTFRHRMPSTASVTRSTLAAARRVQIERLRRPR